MTLAPLLEAFDQLDLSEMPDVHALESDRAQVLWVLAAIKKATVESATATDVSSLLRDRCGVAVSRQRVAGILDNENGTTVARIGRKSPSRYKLMQKGEDEVLAIDTQPLFVDPENALSSIRKVEGIFELLKGDLLVCDTYVDHKTFDYLALADKAGSIKLLTENVQNETRFRRDLAAFTKQYKIPVEVRRTTGLHDRYLIYHDGMFLFGSSIKDIGKKQSLVVRLPEGFATQMALAFNRTWVAASKF